MKVCILATGYPRYKGDFDTIYIHRLARELVKKGAEVHAIAPHAKGLRKEEDMDGVIIHRFQYMYPQNFQSLAYFPGIPENIKKPFNKLQVPPFALSMAQKMMAVTRKYDIDLINAHWAIPSGFLAVMTRRFHHLPVITTLYGVELFTAKSKYSILKPILQRAISGSDGVVAISDGTRDAGYEIDDSHKIEVIPYGVDIHHFSPHKQGVEVKRRHNLDGYQVIFSCGRMVERKGFEYLIRAMPVVGEKIPNTKLILVGEGTQKTKLMELASNLGISENVVFPGAVSGEELPEYYAACDMFVLPSIVDSSGDTEGLGITLIEAMASGKPVIGSNVGGIPYIVHDGEGYGFLVEQKNTSQLSEKIIELLSNKNLREEFGSKGREVAQERFSWGGIADSYLAEFEQMLYKNVHERRNLGCRRA